MLGTEKSKKIHLISAMLSSSRKKNNPKSRYTSRDEELDENSVSTSWKKLLPLAGISAKLNKQE